MATFKTTSCCGLGEAAKLSYPYGTDFDEHLKALIKSKYLVRKHGGYMGAEFQFRLNKGGVFFTSNTRSKNNYAEKFAKGLVANGLGRVRKLPSFVNPNTNNQITLYLWAINGDALIAYIKKQGWQDLVKQW